MFRLIRNLVVLSAPFFSACTFFPSMTAADDWPQFLGPQRNGISAEKNLLNSWPAQGLKTNWKVELGEGMSGIAVAGNRLVTMYQDEEKQYVVCCDVSNGKKNWETPVAPRFENSMGHGPRATPTISGQKVYSYSGEGILTCLEFATGKIIWSKDPHRTSGVKPAEYGMASSPLVVGDAVIVATNLGGDGNTLIAYSTETGKKIWGGGKIHPGYASPMPFKVGQSTLVLGFGGTALIALQPTTGKQLWRYPFETEYNCNTANPIQIGRSLFISSGENHGSVLLELETNSSKMQLKEKWSSLGRDSSLRSEWQTPIYYQNHLYGMDNVGSAGPITNLVCLDAKTGKQKWIKKRFGKGNLIFADGKLILSTMKGELVVVKADPNEFQELGRQKLIGQTRQAPSLSNGKVYLRDNREMICVDLSR